MSAPPHSILKLSCHLTPSDCAAGVPHAAARAPASPPPPPPDRPSRRVASPAHPRLPNLPLVPEAAAVVAVSADFGLLPAPLLPPLAWLPTFFFGLRCVLVGALGLPVPRRTALCFPFCVPYPHPPLPFPEVPSPFFVSGSAGCVPVCLTAGLVPLLQHRQRARAWSSVPSELVSGPAVGRVRWSPSDAQTCCLAVFLCIPALDSASSRTPWSGVSTVAGGDCLQRAVWGPERRHDDVGCRREGGRAGIVGRHGGQRRGTFVIGGGGDNGDVHDGVGGQRWTVARV